jgi:hypothetical protein
MGGIYDCKILCEVGGGQGSIEYTYATMSWDGQTGSAGGPAEPTEPQEPYKGAIAIPGTVEAENYDKGGNGFGYKDSDSKNEGGEYREDGVDIVKANDGYAVGYTTSSEWLTYTVKVDKAGTYDVEAYAANGNTDIEIDLLIDDKKVGSLSGSGAGNEDWDTYVKIKGSVTLPAGEHILKVAFASDYNNLDYIKFYDEEGNLSTSVAETFKEQGVFITPNPAKEHFVITSEENVASVEIVNITGQVVSRSADEKVINFSLPAGTYIVKIITEDGNSYVKRLCVK